MSTTEGPSTPELLETGGPRRRRRVVGLVTAVVVLAGAAGGGVVAYQRLTAPEGAADATAQFLLATDVTTDGDDQSVFTTAAREGSVVAAGRDDSGGRRRALFLHSTDGGTTWQPAQVDGGELGDSPTVVVAHGEGYLALGERAGGSVVWTSADGSRWQREALPEEAFPREDRPADVVSTGEGLVAVGTAEVDGTRRPAVWTSPDGATWERRAGTETGAPDEGRASDMNAVALRGSTLVAVGSGNELPGEDRRDDGLVWRSTDGGQRWDPVRVPDMTEQGYIRAFLTDVVDTGREFVAVGHAGAEQGYDGRVLRSADGASWTLDATSPALATADQDFLYSVARVGDGWVAGGTSSGLDDDGLLAFSRDTRTWSEVAVGALRASADQSVSSLVDGGAGRLVVTASTDEAGDGDVLLLAGTPQAPAPATVDLTGVLDPSRSMAALAVGPGGLVVVGATQGDAALWTSPDGRQWTRRNQAASVTGGPRRQGLGDVAAGPGGYVAVGIDRGPIGSTGIVLRSSDGAQWTRVPGGAFRPQDDFDSREPYAVAAGGPGYVAVGYATEGDADYSAAVWTSPDGTSWTRVQDGAEDPEGGAADTAGPLTGSSDEGRSMYDVSSGPQGLVAVGYSSDERSGDNRSRPTLWTSEDGSAWELEVVPLPEGADDGFLAHVEVLADGRVVATGSASRTGSSNRPFTVTRAAGAQEWTLGELPGTDASAYVNSLLVEGDRVYALGGAGEELEEDAALWTTTDGADWRRLPTEGPRLGGPGQQSLGVGAVVDGTFVGLGSHITTTTADPTLWRSPLRELLAQE